MEARPLHVRGPRSQARGQAGGTRRRIAGYGDAPGQGQGPVHALGQETVGDLHVDRPSRSGGVGSALADTISGYFLWAPWTLLIKGIEGGLVGSLVWWGHRRFPGWKDQVVSGSAILAGGVWMVLGYYMAGTILFGSIAALTEIPGNLVQAGAGLMAALPLSILLRRALKRSHYGSDAY